MKVRFFSICGSLILIGLPLLRADEVLTVADRLVSQHLSYIYGSEDLRNGGLDCSGFVQVVFRESCGIELPNEADKQLEYCREHGQVWDSTSAWMPETLQPGDLITTGTPGGVAMGMESPKWLAPGDTVRIEMTGLGRMETRVTEEPRS